MKPRSHVFDAYSGYSVLYWNDATGELDASS
jgi:hypothetical protein